MKGAVRRGRLNHVQLPARLLWKWQIDPRRTLLRGTYSVVDVDISMNDCALDSRRLVLRFGSFVALSSPRGISFVYWKIFKFAAWNLQKVVLIYILFSVIQKQFLVIWKDSIEKQKLRMKVLPIGLGWNKCGHVTTSAHFPKLRVTLVCKLYLLDW